MEIIKKIFVNILFVIFVLAAITVTILMLSYNDYHYSVIGGYTFIKLTDDELEPTFNEGDLVLVKQTKAKNINQGDYIFLYRTISTTQFEVKYGEVLLKDTTRGEANTQYILEGSTVISHEDVIGSTKDMIVIPHLGTILSILESRYGFLFLVVVPSFVILLYQIYELVMEIKYGDREEEEEDYEDEYDEEYEEEYEEGYDEEYEDDYEEVEVKKPVRKTTAKKAVSRTASKSTGERVASKSTPGTKSARKPAGTAKTASKPAGARTASKPAGTRTTTKSAPRATRTTTSGAKTTKKTSSSK